MELFIEIAKPNKNGISRWVQINEFVGIYKELQLGNGGSWCRASSSLAKKYIVEFDKSQTSGNSIDAIRLNGFNEQKLFNQAVRKDIYIQLAKYGWLLSTSTVDMITWIVDETSGTNQSLAHWFAQALTLKKNATEQEEFIDMMINYLKGRYIDAH